MRHKIARAAAFIILVSCSTTAQATTAADVEFGLSQATLNRVSRPWAIGLTGGAGVRLALNDHWWLRLGLDWHRLWNDTVSTHSLKLPHPNTRSDSVWTTASLSLAAIRAFDVFPSLAPYGGLGLGWSSWRIETYPNYDPIFAPDANGKFKSFRADELTALAVLGIEPVLTGPLRLRAQVGFDFLTGFGAHFANSVNDRRSRGQFSLSLGLTLPLSGPQLSSPRGPKRPQPGSVTAPTKPQVAPAAAPSTSNPGDEDHDGVDDAHDHCPKTPVGAVVDRTGCPLDGDGDGVFDGLDHCPGTLPEDRTRVDSTGCVPQLAETTHVAVAVADADSDGVNDDRDQCPDTPHGLEVDSTGCLVMTQLDRRLILHVVYVPGTTDPDPQSVRILNDLAIRLRNAPNVHATVAGFTDDIGEAEANRKVSQKRADKVRVYLIGKGIMARRITAIGRGETGFIADNATALGRRHNRRIEISFK
ncbi:MAG: OmpA family protein [candidate division Zixibacteria bacterium]|nr:OmpA family protein [candidate division Zixibacteria bacterium]